MTRIRPLATPADGYGRTTTPVAAECVLGGDGEPCVPSGCATTRWWPDGVGVVAAAGEQPGCQRVGVPHLAGASFVATPGEEGAGRDQLEHRAGHDAVGADAPGAVDRGYRVRNGAVAPAADLVAEQPRTAPGRRTDRPFGGDPAVGGSQGPHRCHLDGVGMVVQLHDQGRVVEVQGRAVSTGRGERLVGTAAAAHALAPTAGPERQPVQVHAGDAPRAWVRCHGEPAPTAATTSLIRSAKRPGSSYGGVWPERSNTT